MKVKTYCISVSKTADLVQVLPDVIAKELKSMNIYFLKDSDVVTTIVRIHINEATPMDVNTHTSSASRRRSHRENAKSAKTNQRKITTASSTATMTRKADPYGSWDGRQKGKPKGKGEFGGSCSNCREMGHRSRDCWSERSKRQRHRAATTTTSAATTTTTAATRKEANS